MGDHSESGENKDVYFGVPEEPKEVLVENWVSAPCRVKECGI